MTAEEATIRSATGHADIAAFEEAVARAGYKARRRADEPEDALPARTPIGGASTGI